jgi:aminopeptidase N
VFRAGIRKYMADHAYGNTTTADLWRALETASGKPVAAVAAGFTEQAGVPMVIAQAICAGGTQRIALRQERFTLRDPDAAPRQWQVPVAIGPLRALQPVETVVVRAGSAEVAAGPCGEPVKVNHGDIGYFRVEYDAATQASLTKSFPTMAVADRVNFLADTWALVEAGRAPPASYLNLIEEIGNDDSRAIWNQVAGAIGRLDFLQRRRPERPAFQAYARVKLRSIFTRLGWDAQGHENDDQELLRARLIRMLGELGDQQILAEARRRFDAFLQNPDTLRPALRDPVIQLAGATANRATYDKLIALARTTTNASERVRYYGAAAAARDPALAKESLERTLADEMPISLVSSTISAVAWNGEQGDLAWAFLRKHFEVLSAKQGPAFRSTFVSNFMTSFTERTRAAELKNFAPVYATTGGRIMAERAEEMILINADLTATVLPAVDEWIKTRAAKD